MRAALVSPYSWTYPGGVTRHIEALAGELAAGGHEIRVFAPFDHDTRTTALLHRGARPQVRSTPGVARAAGRDDRLADQRRRLQPRADPVDRLRRCGASCAPSRPTSCTCTSRSTPVIGWDALTSVDAPLVGTFHCYSESRPPHYVAVLLGARRKLNRLHLRLAVSEAAAWTGRRFYGGHYRVVPNGVGACGEHRSRAAARPASRCGSSSSARRSSARACPCCCAPSRRCAARSPPS